MPNPLWTGAISFGLVTIPVKMYSASRSHDVSFNQLHRSTGNRIRYRKVDEATGEEVEQRDIVKGFDLGDGQYVTLEDRELSELRPEATKTLDISDFVDLNEIDPIYYDKTYYVVPDKSLAARRAYALLLEAMEERNRAGVGTVVIRSKQYLAAVRPYDGHLAISTMRFAEDVVDPATVPELEVEIPPTDERAKTMAASLIDSLTTEFDPDKFADTYTDEVRLLIDKKAQGETITPAPRVPESPKVLDLMAALEASVAAARSARAAHEENDGETAKESGRETQRRKSKPKPKGKPTSKDATKDQPVERRQHRPVA